ncbi:hypothetical protein F3N42_14025 [Marinihelvus fidelis]|uniref:Sialidase domain-containing protein n=2 Tax=Marinihelvus fidelis TaxID=2613842 RepID=A0A5N0T7N0_9GAMM|nr:hypothetical protein F3N42_14025 [Marinihelvus fidelis]
MSVTDGLLDPSRPDDLGLERAPGTETATIFRPGPDDDRFAHGVVLMPFKGRLYAQWQSSVKDEDGADTHVVFAHSDDALEWSAPQPLAATMDAGIRTSGGWWTDGETLVAYINQWPDQADGPVQGVTMFRSSTDGEDWTELAPVTDHQGNAVAGVFEQDPRALPGGRILSAFHEQPGLLVAPWYTDDPLGTSGWTRSKIQRLDHDDPTISREIEPSWFLRPDGAVVMIFRDQAGTFRKLASVSTDNGETWSTPALTTVPDSRTKQSAGNLPDGTVFLAGNPVENKARFPLALLLSDDGQVFDRAWLLRAGGDDMQPLRYEGKYKRPSYSYPKSVVWGDHLYVAYATNKEDVEFTRVPLEALGD